MKSLIICCVFLLVLSVGLSLQSVFLCRQIDDCLLAVQQAKTVEQICLLQQKWQRLEKQLCFFLSDAVLSAVADQLAYLHIYTLYGNAAQAEATRFSIKSSLEQIREQQSISLRTVF